jgi:hypothetical protein
MLLNVKNSLVLDGAFWIDLSIGKININRSVKLKQKDGKCITRSGGQESIQNFSGKLMVRKHLGNLSVEYKKLKLILKI